MAKNERVRVSSKEEKPKVERVVEDQTTNKAEEVAEDETDAEEGNQSEPSSDQFEENDGPELEETEEDPAPSYKQTQISPQISELAGVKAAEPEEEVEDDEGIMMMFPTAVNLQAGGIMHNFGRGIHRVPVKLSTHWYLKHSGVKAFREARAPVRTTPVTKKKKAG